MRRGPTEQPYLPFSERGRGESEISFEILTHLGSLGMSRGGWKRELNIVSWNGKPARLDIRDWSPDHSKMGRGVGLNGAETENLIALLKGFNPEGAGI